VTGSSSSDFSGSCAQQKDVIYLVIPSRFFNKSALKQAGRAIHDHQQDKRNR
jgi:hypothetical protein